MIAGASAGREASIVGIDLTAGTRISPVLVAVLRKCCNIGSHTLIVVEALVWWAISLRNTAYAIDGYLTPWAIGTDTIGGEWYALVLIHSIGRLAV